MHQPPCLCQVYFGGNRMHTRQVSFMLSALRKEQFPTSNLPEIAFAGRSNVGKSSLINTLIGQKQVARVSSTPGRTQAVNFFLIDGVWVFVDLPGYGFAKVPPAVKASWKKLIESYLVDRTPLQGVVLIVDIRREPMESDLQLKEFLHSQDIPVLLVATKVDKLSRQQADRQISTLARAMEISADSIVRFSSLSRVGRQELWEEVASLMREGADRMKALRIEAQKAGAGSGTPMPTVITRDDGSWDMPGGRVTEGREDDD